MAINRPVSKKWLHAFDSPVHNFGWALGANTLLGGGLNAQNVGSAVLEAGLQSMLGPYFLPVVLAPALTIAGTAIGRGYNEAKGDWRRTTRTTRVNQEAAATMRQRAIQAIHNSRMNARSALGQEASLMHR